MSEAAAGRPRPMVLCVLDGWGYREDPSDNAVMQAHTPALCKLWTDNPHALLQASEEWVGLPKDQIGNSEVGHMNLGAGRVVMQDLLRIDKTTEQDAFGAIPALAALIAQLKQTGGTCHLMGLVSEGGVHSLQSHITAVAKAVSAAGVPVVIHAWTDGRDVPPQAAEGEMTRFLNAIAPLKGVTVGTLGGRYFAMDRDNRWDRVEKSYRAMVIADAPIAADPLTAIRESYAAGRHDEFILPVVIDGYAGMNDGDGLVIANFRADRVRQIAAALVDPAFAGFERPKIIHFAGAVTMTEYSSALGTLMPAMFAPQSLDKGLGEIAAAAGLRQLRAAETEKYPHVTFFFNGGREQPYAGEDRIMVPSPKVATYDLDPAMSANELTDKVVAAIETGAYDLIIMNYANMDMVGHTGMLGAAIAAVEAVDRGIARIAAAVESRGGALLVTADHGNCEVMRDAATGAPHTAHTLNVVPMILAGAKAGTVVHDGRLADVAPTILDVMGLPQPAEMTGQSLVSRDGAAIARRA